MSSSQYERRKSRSEQETMQKPLKMSHKKIKTRGREISNMGYSALEKEKIDGSSQSGEKNKYNKHILYTIIKI